LKKKIGAFKPKEENKKMSNLPPTFDREEAESSLMTDVKAALESNNKTLSDDELQLIRNKIEKVDELRNELIQLAGARNVLETVATTVTTTPEQEVGEEVVGEAIVSNQPTPKESTADLKEAQVAAEVAAAQQQQQKLAEIEDEDPDNPSEEAKGLNLLLGDDLDDDDDDEASFNEDDDDDDDEDDDDDDEEDDEEVAGEGGEEEVIKAAAAAEKALQACSSFTEKKLCVVDNKCEWKEDRTPKCNPITQVGVPPNMFENVADFPTLNDTPPVTPQLPPPLKTVPSNMFGKVDDLPVGNDTAIELGAGEQPLPPSELLGDTPKASKLPPDLPVGNDTAIELGAGEQPLPPSELLGDTPKASKLPPQFVTNVFTPPPTPKLPPQLQCEEKDMMDCVKPCELDDNLKCYDPSKQPKPRYDPSKQPKKLETTAAAVILPPAFEVPAKLKSQVDLMGQEVDKQTEDEIKRINDSEFDLNAEVAPIVANMDEPCGVRGESDCVDPCEWDITTNKCFDKALPGEFGILSVEAPVVAPVVTPVVTSAIAAAEEALQECRAFTNKDLCVANTNCDWKEDRDIKCAKKLFDEAKADLILAEEKLDGKKVVVMSEIPGHRPSNGVIMIDLIPTLTAAQVRAEIAKQLRLPDNSFGLKTSLFGGKVVTIQKWDQSASTATSGGKSVLIAYPIGEVSVFIVDKLTKSQIEATFTSDTSVAQIKDCIASNWQIQKVDQQLTLTDSTAEMFEAMGKYPPQCVTEFSKDSGEVCTNEKDDNGLLIDPISHDVIDPKNLIRIRCNGRLFCYDIESIKENQVYHDKEKTQMFEATSRIPFTSMLSAKIRGQPTQKLLNDIDTLGSLTSDPLVMIELTRPANITSGPLSQNIMQPTIKGCGVVAPAADLMPECVTLLESMQFPRPQIEKWVSDLKASGKEDVLAQCKNLNTTIERCKNEVGFKDYSFVPLMIEQEKWDISTFISQCEAKEKTLANPFVTARCTELLTPLTHLTSEQLAKWYQSLSGKGKTVFNECQNLPGAIEQCKAVLDLNEEQAGEKIAQYMEIGYDAQQMVDECQRERREIDSGFVRIDETPEEQVQAETSKLSWWQRFKQSLDRKKEERKAKKALYDQEKAQRAFDTSFSGYQPVKEDTSFFTNLFPGQIKNDDWNYKPVAEKPFDWNYKPAGPSWTDKIKNFFKSDAAPAALTATPALFDMALASPGAAYKARDIVVGLERKTLDELIRAISELVALLGADEAVKIMQHTRTSVIGELDKMCLRRGWALFDEVAKKCVPLVEEAAATATTTTNYAAQPAVADYNYYAPPVNNYAALPPKYDNNPFAF
jgi:hypothetical protein